MCNVTTGGGEEFLSTSLHDYFSSNGIPFCLTCPHISPQNGKTERHIRTTNDVVRMLLLQAALPPPFWVEALHTATMLLNIRPSRAIHHFTPYFLLYGVHPTYDHLRTFGCLCYPNISATATHKLSPRSVHYVFIGYPREQKGYRCLDLATRKVIISQHVTFDESFFPFFVSTESAAVENPLPSHPGASIRSDPHTSYHSHSLDLPPPIQPRHLSHVPNKPHGPHPPRSCREPHQPRHQPTCYARPSIPLGIVAADPANPV